eukprot:3405112-Rhodomonas_salina.1
MEESTRRWDSGGDIGRDSTAQGRCCVVFGGVLSRQDTPHLAHFHALCNGNAVYLAGKPSALDSSPHAVKSSSLHESEPERGV